MKKLLILLIFILLSSSSYADEQKHILLLNSYHQGMTWLDNIVKGVYDTLEVNKNNIIIHIENMDTKRYNSEEYYNSLANLYKIKYANTKFDIILSSDNNAFDFLKKYKDEIFGKEVPVSFCGVNNFTPALLDGYDNYTGVVEVFSDVETVELMLRLHPKAKEIYIINDYLVSGRAWEAVMRKDLKPYENKIKITYAKNQTLEELQDKIHNLPKDTLILLGAYYADKNKKYITYEKIGQELLDKSDVPVYCLLNFNISEGVIGGSVINGYSQGVTMAGLAKSILNGVNIKDLAVVTEGANKFIFNKKALDKFNIDIKKLPINKQIINVKESFYEKYGLLVSIILISFSILLSIAIYLYYKKDITSENNILKLLVYGPIIFIPTMISVLIYSILTNNSQLHEENLKNIVAVNIVNQKNITKNVVDNLSNTLEQFKQDRDKLLEYINTTKYGKNGYLFALDIKGNVLAHGTKPELIGKNMYNAKDSNNILFIKKLIENGLRNSSTFVEYQWENPSTKEVSTKYSYSKLLPEYNIIVGSGVYDEDIKSIIYKKTMELNSLNKKQVRQILLISLVILIVFTILAVILSGILKKIFQNYKKEIDNKNRNLKKLNLSLKDRIAQEVKKSREKDILIFQQSKMAAMGEMLGNIAHQWRQPLSVISTAATGIKFKKEYHELSDKDFYEACDCINENAQYLSTTIDGFTDYLKNEWKKETFNIKDNINTLLELVGGSINKSNIKLILDIDKTINITGYSNELLQSMVNIIDNSIDALKNIEDERYIFITVKNKKDSIDIIFKDNAKGIPEKLLSKIFEPYFTTKHKSQGRGLGLSMAYNIITEGMKGTISAKNIEYNYENVTYTGAQVTITLPLSV